MVRGVIQGETMKHKQSKTTDEVPQIFVEKGLLSHRDEMRLSNLVQKGMQASAKLAKQKNTAGNSERLKRDIVRSDNASLVLLERNQGLVGNVVRKYIGLGLSRDDLMQEGQIGLLKAIERYDPKRGTRFSTYAVWWIRQAVGRAVANTGRTIRLPVNLELETAQLRRAKAALMQNLGRDATEAELAKKLQWTIERLRIVNKSDIQIESLDAIIESGNGDNKELTEWVSDKHSVSVEKQVAITQVQDNIESALQTLSHTEAAILRMRFGFASNEMYSLSSISSKFGLSKEGVRQIAVRALGKIRKSNYAEQLREAYQEGVCA